MILYGKPNQLKLNATVEKAKPKHEISYFLPEFLSIHLSCKKPHSHPVFSIIGYDG